MADIDCTQFEDLFESALLVIANAKKLRDWVNGDEFTDVELGGVLTPTLRKLVADIDARESEAARKVIEAGVRDIERLKDEAEKWALAARGFVGTGKCPVVTRRVQELAQKSGTDIEVPAHYPSTDGIHVYCNGVLLSHGLHYQERMPADGEEQTTAITALFDIEAGTEWEFHTWVNDEEQPELPDTPESNEDTQEGE